MINTDKISHIRLFRMSDVRYEILEFITDIRIVLRTVPKDENICIGLDKLVVSEKSVSNVQLTGVPGYSSPLDLVLSNGSFISPDLEVYINISGADDGVYTVEGSILRPRCINIVPTRKIQCLEYQEMSGIDLNDGYNVGVKYEEGRINIIGGPGEGLGRYSGMQLNHKAYNGIMSINGIRENRNVLITISDMLNAYGARLSYGPEKKESDTI